MIPPTLEDAATRLGSVQVALAARRLLPLDWWALPKRYEPKRLAGTGAFHLGAKLLEGLSDSPLYYSGLGKGYDRSDKVREGNRRQYEADLDVFMAALRPALAQFADESLEQQRQQLSQLRERLLKPGIEDALHDSAERILAASREATAGGSDVPTDDARVPPGGDAATGTVADAGSSADPMRAADVAAGGSLPGGVTMSEEQAAKAALRRERQAAGAIPRARLLKAIAEERSRLAAAGDEPSRRIAGEAAQLLACFAVHPDAVRLLREYSRSPLLGSAAMIIELQRATEATVALRKRLVEVAPDDAWGFTPLVIGAMTRLRLHEITGAPEFAVGIGKVIAQTLSEKLSTATIYLMIGLTIAFSGPFGAVAVGGVDLAIGGIDAGMALLKRHEQAIAANASSFRVEEEKLADPPSDVETALIAAVALLSAVAIVSGGVRLLKAKPRLQDTIRTGATPRIKTLQPLPQPVARTADYLDAEGRSVGVILSPDANLKAGSLGIVRRGEGLPTWAGGRGNWPATDVSAFEARINAELGILEPMTPERAKQLGSAIGSIAPGRPLILGSQSARNTPSSLGAAAKKRPSKNQWMVDSRGLPIRIESGKDAVTIDMTHWIKDTTGLPDMVEFEAELLRHEGAINRIIREEGIAGLKQRILDFRNPKIRREIDRASASAKRALGSLPKGRVWSHYPDAVLGADPKAIGGHADSRINSIIGSNAKRLTDHLLDLPDDTGGIFLRMILTME